MLKNQVQKSEDHSRQRTKTKCNGTEEQEVRLQCPRDRAPLTLWAPKMGLDMMLRAGGSHLRVKAREEQDPIWDVGRASCLPAVGRKRRGSRAWE